MTREQFYEENPEFNHIGSPIAIFEQIIIDDFKSRICENCKHSEYYESADRLHCHKLFEEQNQRCYKCETDCTLFEITKDFGCLRFERKEK